jgi:hypothetical protein
MYVVLISDFFEFPEFVVAIDLMRRFACEVGVRDSIRAVFRDLKSKLFPAQSTSTGNFDQKFSAMLNSEITSSSFVSLESTDSLAPKVLDSINSITKKTIDKRQGLEVLTQRHGACSQSFSESIDRDWTVQLPSEPIDKCWRDSTLNGIELFSQLEPNRTMSVSSKLRASLSPQPLGTAM